MLFHINTAYQSIYWKTIFMIEFGKEYFNKPYYFYLKDRGDKISVYYSVSNTITESRKKDEELEFNKKDADRIKKFISKLFDSGKKIPKSQLDKMLKSMKSKGNKEGGEIDELVKADGSMMGSNVPILNQRLVTKNTMDQTVKMTTGNVWPFVRMYFWESEDDQENPIIENDLMATFGGPETSGATSYEEANEIIYDMGVEDPIERQTRTERLGFDPELDKQLDYEQEVGECEDCFVKKRLTELGEAQMRQMVDEILLGKKSKNKDLVKQFKDEQNAKDESPISKILKRNIESIKKIAEKEGISIHKLMKHFKDSE
jgi:hypothetical protein